MKQMRIVERTMMIDAIYWQPNERLLTVRTADGGNTQIGGRLSQDELVDRLGDDLAGRIQMPERLAPELSDLAVHALRGEGLGYLRSREDGSQCVIPSKKDASGNTVPVDIELEQDEADERIAARP